MNEGKAANAIYSLIDEFIELLEDAKPVKKGEYAGKHTVDADELYELLEEMRIAIPKEVKQAQEILESSDSDTKMDSAAEEAAGIIESAKNKADELLKQAQEKADNLENMSLDLTERIRNSKEVRDANDKAKKISAEVEENAKQMHDYAVEYANTFFADILNYLDSYKNIIAENRRELNDPVYAQEKERRRIEEQNKIVLRERLMREVNINTDSEIEKEVEATEIKPKESEIINETSSVSKNVETEETIGTNEMTVPETVQPALVENKKRKRGRPKKIQKTEEIDEKPDSKTVKEEISDDYLEGTILTILKYHDSGYIQDGNRNEYFFDIHDFDELPEKLELGQGVRFKVKYRYDEKKNAQIPCAVGITFNGKDIND